MSSIEGVAQGIAPVDSVTGHIAAYVELRRDMGVTDAAEFLPRLEGDINQLGGKDAKHLREMLGIAITGGNVIVLDTDVVGTENY
ncbi:MAG: hypothetical protein JWL85_637 [Candidatus Saccharibacteria bacterium]|nr:hypothetical protein [Candidatus Saccharibacteria bacterium]